MARLNNVTKTRRELIVRIARLHREGRLQEEIDRIPIDLAPRDGTAIRCCPYKDRAVLKYRLMSILGHGMESEVDELTPLSQYATEAIARAQGDRANPPSAAPSVLDIACDSCTKGGHHVTDACRGCVARPCTTTCPKNAITIVNGRAAIDAENCINCGLCTKECPFHAIIYRPVPCEEVCPVEAIEKDETGRIVINEERCISCGRCLGACPFSAVMDRSQIIDVLERLRGARRVVAAIAPAGIGQFSAPFEKLVSACKAIGFDAVYEVAAGADEVVACESDELRERLEEGASFMTSSCCPAFVSAVEQHYTALSPYVSETESPMVVTGRRIREADEDAIVVFIGPCLAKKREARRSQVIDYCLSFEELGAIFVASNVDVQECPPQSADEVGGAAGRGFPVAGGLSDAIEKTLHIKSTRIEGLDREATRTLSRLARDPEKGAPEGAQFIEVMACPGGCVGGPLAYGDTRAATRAVRSTVAASSS